MVMTIGKLESSVGVTINYMAKMWQDVSSIWAYMRGDPHIKNAREHVDDVGDIVIEKNSIPLSNNPLRSLTKHNMDEVYMCEATKQEQGQGTYKEDGYGPIALENNLNAS